MSTPVWCRVCGSELWWAGSAGQYRWLHVYLMHPDHEGLPDHAERSAR